MALIPESANVQRHLTDILDGDTNPVPAHHRPNPFRRTGGNDVAREQRGDPGCGFDHFRNVDYEIAGVGILLEDVVDPQPRLEARRVRNLVRRNDIGAKWAKAVIRLAHDPLLVATHDHVDKAGIAKDVTKGIGASPGAATGKLAFTAGEAVERAHKGEKVLLVRKETSPEDVAGMHSAVGILTSTGGKTSHAAVVAVGWGTCCVVGAGELSIDEKGGKLPEAANQRYVFTGTQTGGVTRNNNCQNWTSAANNVQGGLGDGGYTATANPTLGASWYFAKQPDTVTCNNQRRLFCFAKD